MQKLQYFKYSKYKIYQLMRQSHDKLTQLIERKQEQYLHESKKPHQLTCAWISSLSNKNHTPPKKKKKEERDRGTRNRGNPVMELYHQFFIITHNQTNPN